MPGARTRALGRPEHPSGPRSPPGHTRPGALPEHPGAGEGESGHSKCHGELGPPCVDPGALHVSHFLRGSTTLTAQKIKEAEEIISKVRAIRDSPAVTQIPESICGKANGGPQGPRPAEKRHRARLESKIPGRAHGPPRACPPKPHLHQRVFRDSGMQSTRARRGPGVTGASSAQSCTFGPDVINAPWQPSG